MLRFIAFLSVFCFHLLPDTVERLSFIHSAHLRTAVATFSVSTGFGLCLFFTLSAYLIATLILRERARSGTVDLGAFYKRRVLRIWPLYFTVLTAAFAACTLRLGFPGFKILAAYVFLLANCLEALHISAVVQPLMISHLWSISVEEQFYLLFPLAAKKLKVSFLYVLPGLLWAVAVVTMVYQTRSGAPKVSLWYNSFVEFSMFAAGIAIALFFQGRSLPSLSRFQRGLVLLLGCLLFFAAQYLCHVRGSGLFISKTQAVAGYTMVMLGCSAVLISFLGYEGPLPKSLIFLGKISYGLYVFHVWCIELSATIFAHLFHISMAEGTAGGRMAAGKDALALMLTVLAATLSYRFIEAPFLKLKHRFEVIKTRPV